MISLKDCIVTPKGLILNAEKIREIKLLAGVMLQMEFRQEYEEYKEEYYRIYQEAVQKLQDSMSDQGIGVCVNE